jgi:hypothetical protein
MIMHPDMTLGAAVWKALTYTAASIGGSAIGAFLVLGGAKLFHWLKRRAT